MRQAFLAATVLVGLQSTPAFADKVYAVTPSRTAEMLFPGKPQAVVGQISSKCIDVRWSVTSTTSNEVVCQVPMNMGQAILGQMLLGNSYSTPPRQFVRFNVAEINGISRVQGNAWMELQMAFGQMRRTELSGPKFENGIMNFLGAAGGKFPVGTTFPNHAALGIQADNVAQGKLTYFRIKEITPGAAAEKADIRVGDVITGIEGKTFKTYDDYLDATAKAAAKPTYEVAFIRDGKAMKASVERAFRPTWSEAVVPTEDAPSTMALAAPPTSVADELSKLLELKKVGALTEPEFEAQKKKLLDRQ